MAPDLQGFLVFTVALVALFVLPGFSITLVFFPRDDLDLLERLPIGFCLTLGLFLLLFFLTSLFPWTWEAVQWVWIGAVGVLVAGALLIGYRRSHHSSPTNPSPSLSRFAGVALLVVLVLSAILTLYTTRDEDDWSYYAIVRSFADNLRFTPFSPTSLRYITNIWWFLHAFLVRTFNLDVVHLGQDYMPFWLVPLSFLSLYLLARTLFESRNHVVLACALQLVFYIMDLFYGDGNVQLTGGWALGRMDQDHTVVQFVFLPVYAAMVIQYLKSGQARWLTASFVSLLVLSSVHPQGFVQAGLFLMAFVVFHLVVSHRREDWKKSGLLLIPFAVVLVLFLPFMRYWQDYTRTDAAFDLASLAAGQHEWPFSFRWLFFLSPTQFILRPDLMGQPALLLSLLLTPGLVLLWRREVAAQYLLGTTAALLLALYVPLFFVPMSSVLGYSIYRLWYLFPTALVISYLLPRLVGVLANGVSQVRRGTFGKPGLGASLCLAGLLLVAARLPMYVRVMPTEIGHSLPAGAYDLFAALRELSSPDGGVVLAPREISDPIPAYRASLSPVAFRYNAPNEKVQDVGAFYDGYLLTSENMSILGKYQVQYLIVPAGQEKISQFDLSNAYFALLYRDTNWALYRVVQPLKANELVRANSLFMSGDWGQSLEAYNTVLLTDPTNALAHTGLGLMQEVSGKPMKAIQEFEQAVQATPTDLQAHYHLAKLYRTLGMDKEAQVHATFAGALMKGQAQ